MSRRSLVLGAIAAIAIGAALAPSRALGGGYDVPACDATVAGGANNSWGPWADGGMTPYTYCPAGDGITARNAYGGGTSSGGQAAYMIFDAPTGTYVESVSFEASLQGHDCSWSVGLFGTNGDLGGNLIWGLPANQTCGTSAWGGSSFVDYRLTYAVNAPRVMIESRCGAATCAR